MRKIATLLLVAGMLFANATGAQAIDFKAKGYVSQSVEFMSNPQFVGDGTNGNKKGVDSITDNFSAGMRLRLQIDAVASSALSGTVYFEIGDIYAGNAESGGALGADGNIVEVKRAYLDWTVPNSSLKLRMGLQGMKLPLMASPGNFILDDDGAGIVASYKFNDNVSLTGMWVRPLNDNTGGSVTNPSGSAANFNDNFDFFGLLLPLKFEGFLLTPWVGYATLGSNNVADISKYRDLEGVPVVSTTAKKMGEGLGVYTGEKGTPYSLDPHGSNVNIWWAGLSGDVFTNDDFGLKFDFMYGSKTQDASRYDPSKDALSKVNGDSDRMNKQGWFGSVLAEYKMDWGTPGIFGWYSSGDDDNVKNGSERMPTISGNWEYNATGFKDTKASGAYDGILAYQPIGLWGLALQLDKVKFTEDWTNKFQFTYMGGTNSAKMPKKIREMSGESLRPIGAIGSYLTTTDSAFEIDWTSTYKIYENLALIGEIAYIHLQFDNDTWKHNDPTSKANTWQKNVSKNPDAFKVGLNFHYSF